MSDLTDHDVPIPDTISGDDILLVGIETDPGPISYNPSDHEGGVVFERTLTMPISLLKSVIANLTDEQLAEVGVIPVEDIDYEAGAAVICRLVFDEWDGEMPLVQLREARAIVDAALALENPPKTPTPENP